MRGFPDHSKSDQEQPTAPYVSVAVPSAFTPKERFPDYVLERQHILHTLICDCTKVYTVFHGWAELRTKPHGPCKARRR